MKLALRIDASEGEDSPCPVPIARWGTFEPVLERELLELHPDAARYQAVELGISLMTPDEIREVNRDHRGLDEPTDVLSFPLWEEEGCFAPDPMLAGAVLPLGDILICPPETVRLHPALPSHEALCLVLAHGFLHLLAWDHDTEEHQKAMWAQQDALKVRLLDALAAERSEDGSAPHA